MTDERQTTGLVEMRVADVRRKQAANGLSRNHVVLLQEIGAVSAPRHLPIWVGEAEGTAIAMHLERVQVPRPPTFAFAANLLQAGGTKLREVHIDRLVEQTFYATAIVEGIGGTTTVDARPSDAINLALLVGAPIRVDAAILETESQPMDAWNEATEGPAEIVAEVMAGWPGHHSGSPESR